MMRPDDHDAPGNGSDQPDDDDDLDLFGEVERKALDALGDEDDEPPAEDLLSLASGETRPAEPAKDVTLGGYIEKHDRVPAFDGSDGQPYTVDVDVEEDPTDPDEPFVAFLIFIRWAATGAGIMDHVESGDVARGRTAEEARTGALDLSLYEIKAELDAAIARRRAALED